MLSYKYLDVCANICAPFHRIRVYFMRSPLPVDAKQMSVNLNVCLMLKLNKEEFDFKYEDITFSSKHLFCNVFPVSTFKNWLGPRTVVKHT